ncbi:hypothetical protein ABZ137_13235 [Streptomyces bobili]|uniref:hypothetical protein n=1 Tax=Streptomyces bobili TaxID=67280 RepID=UPI0033A6DA5D
MAATRLLALAGAEADDGQAGRTRTGLHDVLAEPDGVPGLAAVCGQLARDPEAGVRRGAAEISVWTDVRDVDVDSRSLVRGHGGGKDRHADTGIRRAAHR